MFKKVLQSLFVFVLIAALGMSIVPLAHADAQPSDSLIYRLQFDEQSTMFKNSAGTSYGDAVSEEGNTLSIDTVQGRTGLKFPGGTKDVNYLSLPTEMFKDVQSVTVAGWFFLADGQEPYTCELNIYSPSENAILRADPYANYHGGGYLFIAGDNHVVEGGEGLGVKAVFGGWYHMAYVINGADHTFKVFQNGTEVYSEAIADTFAVSEFAATDSAFLLGQNFSESGQHSDYKGMMSDFRVYSEALNADQLKSEYSLKLDDFKVADYTFDNAEAPLEDSIRGYNLSTYREGSVQYADGTVQLSDGAGLQAFDMEQGKNTFFSDGLTKFTLSMDLSIQSPETSAWKRIVDIHTNRGHITVMAYCPIDGGNYLEINYNNAVENGMTGSQKITLPNNTWFNMTITVDDTLAVYIDGELAADCTPRSEQMPFNAFLFRWSWDNIGNLTFGTNTYETGNSLDVSFDRIQMWAAEATAEEVSEIAKANKPLQLTYNANNGSQEVVTESVRDGSAVVKGNTFTNTGYTFLSWNTQSDGSGTTYNEGDTITLTEDTVLYAQWKADSYFVKFDANGGRGEMSDMAVAYDSEKPLTLNAFVNTGYNFIGWNTMADGTGTPYADGANITLQDNITLYAQWEAKQYTVTFDANGGKGTMQQQQMVFGEEAQLTANAFTREGYIFDGWSITPEGLSQYTDKQVVESIGTGDDITLYAKWTKASYTVKFDANGGNGTMDDITAEALAFVKLPLNTFTKDGMVFVGWSETSDGEVKYTDGQSVVFDGNTTLYAVWSAEKITITFNANGGSGEMQSVDVDLGQSVTIPSNTFTKEGYKFLGWATEEGGEVVYTDGQTITLQADTTLFAVWEKIATPEPQPEQNNTGLIIGIVAAVVLVAAVAVTIILIKRKK